MFQIPNTLTVMRILLVPVFAIAFVIPGEAARLTAFAVFCDEMRFIGAPALPIRRI